MNKVVKILTVTFILINDGETYGHKICKVPNGGGGTCIPIKTCTPILNYSKKLNKTREDVQFLQQTSCGVGIKPKVCCPHESEWETYAPGLPIHIPEPDKSPDIKDTKSPLINALTIPNGGDNPDLPDYRIYIPQSNCPNTLKPPKYDSECCGVDSSTSDKIIGGTEAAVDEYPWLALLEYKGKQIRCGGSLISSRYILTAAHCVGQTRFGPAIRVRLAEFNTSSYPIDYVEVNGDGYENVTVVEITVERQVRHPEFVVAEGSTIHDIGLVKLSKNAPYTEFIRPVCLPPYDASSSDTNLLLTAAGWGSNTITFNTVKQKVSLPFFNTETCKEKYPSSSLLNQFCAGGAKGKDTCNGDSGGPIVYEDEAKGKSIVVGLVSFGWRYCGTEAYPGVYTNVYKYLDWIEKETI